jgi:hypothetical protein
MSFVGYLKDLMSDLVIWKCLGKPAFRQIRLLSQNLMATCSSDFNSKLDDWNKIHFCRHILLAISTTACLILKCLRKSAFSKCDCRIRIWWQHVLAISISSWMTGTRYIFANTICWLSQGPHVWPCNLKVSWKACIQANASAFSEFSGNVFSQFRFQVGCLEPETTEKTTWIVTDASTYLVSSQRNSQQNLQINIIGNYQEATKRL